MSYEPAPPMAPPVPIPSRHPARLSTIKTPKIQRIPQSGNVAAEHLDIWEHAVVLFHGFEWQGAAETFLFLSRNIRRNFEGTLCLLNAAIIFARLGEYAEAAQVLDEAEPNEQTLPLTMFLIGHCQFELGDFEKSESSLRVALHALRGPSQHFGTWGLEFELRASHIQQSLRVLKSKNELVGMLGTLGALPADGVFEAPVRSFKYPVLEGAGRPGSTNSRDSMDSSHVPPLTDLSSPSAPASPIESVKSLPYTNEGMQWHGLPEDPDVQFRAPEGTSGVSKDNLYSRDFSNEFHDRPAPGPRKGFAHLKPAIPPQQTSRRRSKMEPREARVQGDSVGALAEFIKALPPPKNRMQPKEAKVRTETTMKLAEFLRSSGPGEQTSAGPGAQSQGNSSDSESSRSDPNSRPKSIRSTDLRDLLNDGEENYTKQYRATPPPPPSKHPYRSGFGSMLMQESQRRQPQGIHPAFRTPGSFEAAEMSSDDLHDFFTEDQTSMDWPLTDAASTSLRESFASSRASSQTEVPFSSQAVRRSDVPEPLNLRGRAPPVIPNRVSSLRREEAPTRESVVSTPSTVRTSRFFSRIAKRRYH